MHAHQSAGALPVQVQIANMKLASRALELLFVRAVDGAGQSILSVVRNLERVVVVRRLDYRQHRSEDFFLFNRRAWFHISNNRRLDEEALLAIRATTGEYPTALALTLLDVGVDGLESFFVDDRAHVGRTVCRVAGLNLLRAFGNFLQHLVVNPRVDDRA